MSGEAVALLCVASFVVGLVVGSFIGGCERSQKDYAEGFSDGQRDKWAM